MFSSLLLREWLLMVFALPRFVVNFDVFRKLSHDFKCLWFESHKNIEETLTVTFFLFYDLEIDFLIVWEIRKKEKLEKKLRHFPWLEADGIFCNLTPNWAKSKFHEKINIHFAEFVIKNLCRFYKQWQFLDLISYKFSKPRSF
jgi:hypothetical protein